MNLRYESLDLKFKTDKLFFNYLHLADHSPAQYEILITVNQRSNCPLTALITGASVPNSYIQVLPYVGVVRSEHALVRRRGNALARVSHHLREGSLVNVSFVQQLPLLELPPSQAPHGLHRVERRAIRCLAERCEVLADCFERPEACMGRGSVKY